MRARYDESYVDLNPDEEIQTDINIFAFYPYMTENEILNKYDLTAGQVKKVEEVFKLMASSKLIEEPFSFRNNNAINDYSNCRNGGVSYKGWYEGNSKHRLRTMKMMWKSRRIIRAVTHINKITGEKEYTLLKKTDKPRKRDTVETTSFEVIRFIEMLGPEIVLDYGEHKQRMSYIDNRKKVKIPVVHLKGRNTMYSTEIRSVVAKIIPLQNLASNILFELRLAIKANNGRVLVYDLAQIPKQFLDTYDKEGAINRLLHHIKKDKILMYNSKDKNSRATFNQFTSIDLTNTGQTQDLINALMLIEDLARKFVGISKERQGESQKYQTKGNTDTAIRQSNARTEIYFNPFDEFIQSILDTMLSKAKHVYKAGQVFSYIFGDLMTKFLTIYQEFFNSDIGIYLGNRFKDKRDKEIIDQAAVQALGNASDKELILDLINVLQGDSASESKAILEKGLDEFQKLQEQNAKSAQEAHAADQEHEMEIEGIKKQIADDKNTTAIKIKEMEINSEAFNKGEDRTSEELITAAKIILEEEKMALAESKPESKSESTPKKKPKE